MLFFIVLGHGQITGERPRTERILNINDWIIGMTYMYYEHLVRGHQAFVRPSDGCANAEASVAGPYRADDCRSPSAPCGVGAGPTNWTALSTWQPLDGHAPSPNRTNHANRRPPRMGTRQPIPTGKPLRGKTPRHHHHHLVRSAQVQKKCRNMKADLHEEDGTKQ